MSVSLPDRVGSALATFSSITRLYELKLEDDAALPAAPDAVAVGPGPGV